MELEQINRELSRDTLRTMAHSLCKANGVRDLPTAMSFLVKCHSEIDILNSLRQMVKNVPDLFYAAKGSRLR